MCEANDTCVSADGSCEENAAKCIIRVSDQLSTDSAALEPCVCVMTWTDSDSGGTCGEEQVGCPATSCDGEPRWCLTANDVTCATDLGSWTLCENSTPVFGRSTEEPSEQPQESSEQPQEPSEQPEEPTRPERSTEEPQEPSEQPEECADKCNDEETHAVQSAVGASETPECVAVMEAHSMVNGTGPSEEQLAACFASDDFTSLSNYDCKMECGDEQTIAGYVGSTEEPQEPSEQPEEPTRPERCPGADKCNDEKVEAAEGAVGASETPECVAVIDALGMEDGPGPSEEQIAACFGSDDFTSLSDYDCKMSCSDEQTIAGYVAAGTTTTTTAAPAKQVKFSMTLNMAVDEFEAKKDQVKEGIAKSLNVDSSLVEVAVKEQAESRLRRILSEVELEVTVLTDDENAVTDAVTNDSFAETVSQDISESTGVDVQASGVTEPVVEDNPNATKIVTSESDDEMSTGVWILTIVCIVTTVLICGYFAWFCLVREDEMSIQKQIEMNTSANRSGTTV